MSNRLDALNFFLADVRGGLGAYVSVFLVTAAGWTAGEVGSLLTISGLIGIAVHTPVGGMIDAVTCKRGLLVGAVVLLAACAIAIERLPIGPVVFTADVVMAVLGGVFAPTVAAITLGMTSDSAIAVRLARNAVFDRIGNLTIAVVVGLVGWWWSQRATFYLVPLFGLAAAWVILSIPPSAIDHRRARGAHADAGQDGTSVWMLLTGNRALIVLASSAALFHFANAAMLPLVSQKLALAHPGLESMLTSGAILAAQIVSIPVAIAVGRTSARLGFRLLLWASCVVLAVRGVVFATADNAYVLLAAQLLDGVSIGVWDVLTPLVLAEIAAGTGRYSTARGLVSTVQGIGGSISNLVAGVIATAYGYSSAFSTLAAAAVLAMLVVALLPTAAGRRFETAPTPSKL